MRYSSVSMPHHDEVTETLTCYWIVLGFGPLVMSREPLPYLNLLAAVVSIHARSEGSVDSKIDSLVTKREGYCASQMNAAHANTSVA